MKKFETFPCYFMRWLSIPGYLFGNLRGFRGEVNCCLITLNPLTFPGSKQLYVKGLIFLRTKRSLAQILIFPSWQTRQGKAKRMNGQKFKRAHEISIFFSRSGFFSKKFTLRSKKNHSTWWKHVIMINEPLRTHIMQGENVS